MGVPNRAPPLRAGGAAVKVETVLKEVERIRAMRHDDESAHSAEDTLHQRVLKHVANGHPDSKALAQAALLTRDIDFCRWCA